MLRPITRILSLGVVLAALAFAGAGLAAQPTEASAQDFHRSGVSSYSWGAVERTLNFT